MPTNALHSHDAPKPSRLLLDKDQAIRNQLPHNDEDNWQPHWQITKHLEEEDTICNKEGQDS